MSCGVGRRHSSVLMLLWLQCRLAAIVLIGPLAWEPPYAALKCKKERKKERKSRSGGNLNVHRHQEIRHLLSSLGLSFICDQDRDTKK